MQRTMRTILVGVLVLLLSFNPAAAWHRWGGGHRGGAGCGWGGGGYCGGGGYGGNCGSAYSSCNGGPGGYCGGSYGYGYSRVVYSSEPYCGGGGCGSYGGDCGSCGGSSCDGCVGGGSSYESGVSYDGYDPGGTVIESTPHVYEDVIQESAPMPPSDTRVYQAPPGPPATVNRPLETTTPAPTLPPGRTAPAETTPPATTTPPAEDDSLFGPTAPTETPATTPAETPAETPAATDDFFGTEPTTPAETPAEPPAEGGATEPSATDSLFGEPAGSTTPESTPPAEGSTTPAEGTPAEDPLDMFDTPAEGAAPTGDSTSTDKVTKEQTFLASHTVLREPGGLASSEMRTWVDNTGRYSCNGRLVRFMDGQVRLKKENGRTTTVPLYRLSAADLTFVHRQASAQPQGTFAQADASETVTAN